MLPYAVQTFLHFNATFPPLVLYLGDLSMILIALSILRVRGLQLRRLDDDEDARLADWRRTMMQLAGAFVALAMLMILLIFDVDYQTEVRRVSQYFVGAIIASAVLTRRGIKMLPSFLRAPGK
ncbi:MAG: hypothetical protein M3R10_08460 [Verrucomicrobiota bacterium]|nr:hypothetical protein [Verrucomicrobiota bacterium]